MNFRHFFRKEVRKVGGGDIEISFIKISKAIQKNASFSRFLVVFSKTRTTRVQKLITKSLELKTNVIASSPELRQIFWF